MTKKEKQIQIALGTYLSKKWKERCKLRAEADKLWAESNKLRAESSKLHAECSKLEAEAHKLYAEAVIEVYGSKTVIDWETGEVTIEDD